MEFASLLEVVQGGGAAAQVATVAILLFMRRDSREQAKRLKRIERHIWPEVFGQDPPD